jgi:hypothetical protein
MEEKINTLKFFGIDPEILYSQEEGDRFKKWVNLSHKFAYDGLGNLVLYIQDLGRIDIDLMRRDKRLLENVDKRDRNKWQELEFGLFLQFTVALSRLWLLQSYEIVRILKNRIPSDEDMRSFYKLLRRLRIPLAKLEAADGFNSDVSNAQLIMDRRHGVAWATHQEFICSRQEISDKFLTFV